MKLLITDDQQSVHTYLNATIPWEEMGFSEILHAYDGQQCLELLEQERPALLFLDIKMPLMDGMQVLAAMQERGLTLTKTVLLSAYSEFSYAQRAIRFGVQEYLLTPIDREEVCRTVRSCQKGFRERFSQKLRELLLYDGTDTEFLKACSLWRREMQGVLAAHASDAPLPNPPPWGMALDRSHSFFLLPSDADLHSLISQSASLALSTPHQLEHAQDLSRCFEQCQQAAATARFYGETQPVKRFAQNPVISFAEFDSFITSIASNTPPQQLTTQLFNGVERLFAKLAQVQPTPRQAADLCFHLLKTASERLADTLESARSISIDADLHQCFVQADTLAQMKQILCETLQLLLSGTPSCGDDKHAAMESLRIYLAENLGQPLTLDGLARQFLVNKYELCRRFKEHTGESLWSYLTRLRLEYAQSLLLSTDKKVYEIAEACGFQSSAYFSSAFKKSMGMSPQQWKAEHAPDVTP